MPLPRGAGHNIVLVPSSPDEDVRQVYHHKGHVMDIFTPSLVPRYTPRPNCWTYAQIDVPLEEIREYCTVKQVSLGGYTVLSHSY
jgi:hypothetical protein